MWIINAAEVFYILSGSEGGKYAAFQTNIQSTHW